MSEDTEKNEKKEAVERLKALDLASLPVMRVLEILLSDPLLPETVKQALREQQFAEFSASRL